MNESDLQSQVADYLRLQYPDVLFHSDFGSGIKLTPGQAVKQKRQNGGRRSWPDMFIAEPMVTITFLDDSPKWRTRLARLVGSFEEKGDPLDLHNGEFYSDEDYYYGLFLELKKTAHASRKRMVSGRQNISLNKQSY